jgi:hypothetical protein
MSLTNINHLMLFTKNNRPRCRTCTKLINTLPEKNVNLDFQDSYKRQEKKNSSKICYVFLTTKIIGVNGKMQNSLYWLDYGFKFQRVLHRFLSKDLSQPHKVKTGS